MTTLALKLSTVQTGPQNTAQTGTRNSARPAAKLVRRVFTWELAGVLTLLGSSAAYAVFALAHLA